MGLKVSGAGKNLGNAVGGGPVGKTVSDTTGTQLILRHPTKAVELMSM